MGLRSKLIKVMVKHDLIPARIRWKKSAHIRTGNGWKKNGKD